MTYTPENAQTPDQSRPEAIKESSDSKAETTELVKGFGENMQELHEASQQLEQALANLLSGNNKAA